MDLKKRLKNWEKHEIDHFYNTLRNPKPRHVEIRKKLHHMHFWTLVVSIIFTDIVLLGLLIPLVLLVPSPWIFYTIIIVGLGFGILFDWMVSQIDHLHFSHHTINLLIIPLLTFIDVLIVMAVVDRFQTFLLIQEYLNIGARPDVLMFLFGGAFLFPYVVWLIIRKIRED